jgi:CO/xanthine dehydrogenase Mo-binding subunit
MPAYPEYRYIGKNTQRMDAVDIVTGKTTFLDDFRLPKMLCGKALRSPHAHAMIKRIDAGAAKMVKGVHAVLTYKEVPQSWRVGWPLYRPFMDAKLAYVGDIVALVAADTEEIADEAIDLIEVEYEVLQPVFTALESLAPGAPQVYETLPGNAVPPGYPPFQPHGAFWQIKRGDIKEGFEKAAYIAEDTIHFNKMCPPLSPEPPGAIVRWDGGNNYTVWATTQSNYILKVLNSASMLDANLRIMTFNTGGSYGNKQALVGDVVPAALLSRVTNRPVKFFLSKTLQLGTHETRLGATIQAKIGMDKDGRVCVVQGAWLLDSGAYSDSIQGQVGVGLGEMQLVTSKCKYWDFDTNIAITNKIPAGIVRGYGGQELNSCLGLLIARAMKAGNFDPIECYKKNYVQPGDRYQWRDGLWWECKGSHDYPQAMEESARKFGWKDKWKGWGVPTSVNGRKVTGVGAGIIGNADVGEDNTEAYVKIVPDLGRSDGSKVVVQVDITESGMGQRTNVAKMAAEILDVDMSLVQVTDPDTLSNPTGFGLCGSRGTICYGEAVTKATLDVKSKLLEMASRKLNLPAEELDTREGYVYVKADPEKRVNWKGLWEPDLTIMGYGKHIEQFSTPNFCIFIVEVEVDLDTGLTKILKIVSGTDAGQIIDPKTLEMQMQGGIGAACVDTALYEEHIVDLPTGRLMTTNLIDYKWRPFNEFPAFDTVVLQSQIKNASNHFNAVGVGEISGAAGASAVLMAISNAIGEEVAEYPATPDVVLKAIAKKSAAVATAKKGGC